MSVGFVDPPDLPEVPIVPTYATVASIQTGPIQTGPIQVGTIINFIINSPLKNNVQPLSRDYHKKSKCRYCDREAICKTCHHIIKCREESDCPACGGLYGRPIKGPISAGCLIVDLTTAKPFVWLVMEKDANGLLINKFNEPGGKFEPDLDDTPIDTAIREVREETSFMLFLNSLDPYVDLENNGNLYRCYIAIHTGSPIKYMPTIDTSEQPTMKIGLDDFLNINNSGLTSKYKILHHRMRFLLYRKVKNLNNLGGEHQPLLRDYLKKINDQYV